jgi:hypothetical protein
MNYLQVMQEKTATSSSLEKEVDLLGHSHTYPFPTEIKRLYIFNFMPLFT